MTDRPIIFSAPMVRALIDGRKTQTRRALRVQPDTASDPSGMGRWGAVNRFGYWHPAAEARPYAPADRLWVREAWAPYDDTDCLYRATVEDDTDYYPNEIAQIRWRSPIHMPRWASRLTLTVTDVRVQRVQEISEADAVAEGAPVCGPPGSDGSFPFAAMSHRHGFHALWNSLHGHDAWDANPWVAAVSFTVQRRNIDA